jgi:hypothetical protein
MTPSPSNGSTSSSVWYHKNVFDQFNNRDAFGSF